MIFRWLLVLLTGILTSFFFFPFEFTFLPGANVKMILAIVGLALAGYELIRRRNGLTIPLEFIALTTLAVAVSLASLLSISINQTPDTSYVFYVISFLVWLSAAFAVCYCIRAVHGRLDVPLVLNYLTGVCLFQCIFALIVNNYPVVANWVNHYTYFGQEVPIIAKRLYALGAMLDTAGARFAAVLAGLGLFLAEINQPLRTTTRILYIFSFIVISIIGNMIARTTIVGTSIGLAIIVLSLLFRPSLSVDGNRKAESILSWLGILAITFVVCIILYNTNYTAKTLFRFGFEGFFSLVEKGHWEVGSNDILESMVIFPDTIHTWIIGDGYFLNSRYDPNYLGEATTEGYYMCIDIGYLRFLFYFGVIGLIPIMGVIIGSAIVCMRHFPKERILFLLVLLSGLIVWLKVSTDIFCFFALFLSAAALKEYA